MLWISIRNELYEKHRQNGKFQGRATFLNGSLKITTPEGGQS